MTRAQSTRAATSPIVALREGCSGEGVQDGHVAILEVSLVSRDQRERVRARGRSDEHVRLSSALTTSLETSAEDAAAAGDVAGHREDVALIGEKALEPCLDAGVGFPCQTEVDLLEAHDTQADPLHLSRPRNDTPVRPRAGQLAEHVCVHKEAHLRPPRKPLLRL